MSISGPGFGYGYGYDPYMVDPGFYNPQIAGQQNYLGLGQSSHSSLDSLAGMSSLQGAHEPKKKGFLGKVFGGAKALAKGATINFAKSVLSPKGLLTLAAGVALTVATGGAAAPYLIAAGIGMSGLGIAKNGMAAAQLYAAGQDELAEKALENVGTNVTGLGLSVVGARSMVKGGTGKLTADPEASYASSVKQVFRHTTEGTKQAYTNVKGAYQAEGITGVRSLANNRFTTAKSNVVDFTSTVRLGSKSTDELVSLYEKAAGESGAKGYSKSQIQSELNGRGLSVKGKPLKRFESYETQIQNAQDAGNFARAKTLEMEYLSSADEAALQGRIDVLQAKVKGLPKSRWNAPEAYLKNAQIKQLQARLTAIQENPSLVGRPIDKLGSNPFASYLTGGTAQLNGANPGILPVLGGINAGNYDSLKEEIRRMYGQGAF